MASGWGRLGGVLWTCATFALQHKQLRARVISTFALQHKQLRARVISTEIVRTRAFHFAQGAAATHAPAFTSSQHYMLHHALHALFYNYIYKQFTLNYSIPHSLLQHLFSVHYTFS
jgi:hypothetical protein